MAKKTTVFAPSMMQQIIDSATKLATEALGKMLCTLDRDEFIEAFVQPGHVTDLVNIYDLIGGQKAEQMNVRLLTKADPSDPKERMIAQVRWWKQPNILVPKYIQTDLRYFTPAGEKVVAWAEERRRVGFLVADAMDAMHWLNENAGSAMGFSIMFPALAPIMIHTDGDPEHYIVRRGRAIAELKTLPSDLPVLPREVIEHVREASALLLSLLMTKDARLDVPRETCALLVGVPADALSNATIEMYSRPHVIHQEMQNVRSFV